MKRISSQLPTYDSSYYQRLREFDMNQMTNKMGAQSRIKDLRDDPLAAARSTRFQSEIHAHAPLREEHRERAQHALQRGGQPPQRHGHPPAHPGARRAGGQRHTRPSQMGYIGDEVNQLLDELLTIANAKDQSGNSLFAGTLSKTTPFRTTEGRVPGGSGDMVVSVDYLGNIGTSAAEISEGSKVGVNLPGNIAFWAEQQQIYSTVDASQYRVQTASTIRIDGAEIHLSPGDTVSAIAAKINDANAPLKASVDSVTNALVLETTLPHQIWAEDLGAARSSRTWASSPRAAVGRR